MFTKKENYSESMPFVKAKDWFASGHRVQYDPKQKKIIPTKSAVSISVFERVVNPPSSSEKGVRWLTMLPGFPDGSYGYAKIDQMISNSKTFVTTPRLYVEYVGMGDSDKPKQYRYSTIERADLVEAHWRAHGVQRTVVATFDIGSLVLMELLRRQQARVRNNIAGLRIEHLLIVNGGLFVDGHSHPWNTTPLLQTWIGKFLACVAQYSDFLLYSMLEPLYGVEYSKNENKLMKLEIRETVVAIRRYNGTHFMSNAAGIVTEHKKIGDHWNLRSIYTEFCKDQGITMHIVGSEKDQFEHKQVTLSKMRFAEYKPQVTISMIAGGHMSTAEEPGKMVEMIEALVKLPRGQSKAAA